MIIEHFNAKQDCKQEDSEIKIGDRKSRDKILKKPNHKVQKGSKVLTYVSMREKRKCEGLSAPITNEYLCTFSFADDQILFAHDEDDLNSIIQKLEDE